MSDGSARDRVIEAVERQAADFPDISPPPQVGGLSLRDRALAVAIHRTVLQRWLSCQCVLRHVVDQPFEKLEPRLAATLLVGAAQLLFMDKSESRRRGTEIRRGGLPAHAVVDEAVEYAKRRIRPGAGAMVNAVLRKVVGAKLEDYLPPRESIDEYLSAKTSHPVALVRAWRERFGEQRAVELLEHSNVTPPIVVHAPDAQGQEPHERTGFVVWQADHESLREFLAASPRRWVQDVASAGAVAATADLRPQLIVDYCAGRGTKTRQLADVHQQARIIATDTDAGRFAELQRVFAGYQRVQVLPVEQMKQFAGQVDLLLLDVPCSNTGVLARRPEARYRYRQSTLDSLIALQRKIITTAAPLLTPGSGVLIYSTCSIEPVENEQQVQWAARELDRKIISQQVTLPAGEGSTYHDGAFHAVLR